MVLGEDDLAAVAIVADVLEMAAGAFRVRRGAHRIVASKLQ